MDDQSRNLILATALSFLVILGWFVLGPILFPTPSRRRRPSRPRQTAPARRQASRRPTGAAGAPAPAHGAGARGRAGAEDARRGAGADRSACRSAPPRLEGSLSLTGGRIDDLSSPTTRVTIEPARRS